MKIYLAGPFFNASETKTVRSLEKFLESLGHDVFSPSRDGTILAPGSSGKIREKSFREDCEQILASDAVVAVLDGDDPGTIWEIGYAFCSGKRIVAYSSTRERHLSVMISESVSIAFSQGELAAALEGKRIRWEGRVF